MMIDAWLSAGEGDASGLWVSSVLGDVLTPELFVRGQYASAAMLDAEVARDYFAGGSDDPSDLARAASSLAWGGGRLVDAWPASPHEEDYSSVRLARGDAPCGWGARRGNPAAARHRELLPYLPNGREVVLRGSGTHRASSVTSRKRARG